MWEGGFEGEGEFAIKGIGGVLFNPPMQTPWSFRDSLPVSFGEPIPVYLPNFDRIAPIEMQAILRALELFGAHIAGRAVLFFVDNTHAIGCLLKRSTSIRERSRYSKAEVESDANKRRRLDEAQFEYSHYKKFLTLPRPMRRFMNAQAREIWKLITRYDLLVWFEYVKTDCNVADPPSRGLPLPNEGCSIRARDFRSYFEKPPSQFD